MKGDNRNEWWETLKIGDRNVTTQLDTGASKSFMSAKTYYTMDDKPPLRPTKSVFHSYTQHPIPLLGTAVFPVKWKDIVTEVMFNVTEQDQSPLLSGSACQDLGLIQRWETLKIGDRNVTTQLDTGASKSFMSAKTYYTMDDKPPLRPTKSVFHSYT